MSFSEILLILLAILYGRPQIQENASQPVSCKAGEFRFGDLIIPYPTTVGQVTRGFHMEFSGSGVFGKATTLFKHSSGQPIHLGLQHSGMLHKFDKNPDEHAEDNCEYPVLEYRFYVWEKVCSFDSVRTLIEKETGKTFRTFPAASYSAPGSPWRAYLKGQTIYVYTLRINDCMVVNLINLTNLQAAPTGVSNTKVKPFTSVRFILYKSDIEIEELYKPQEEKDIIKKN